MKSKAKIFLIVLFALITTLSLAACNIDISDINKTAKDTIGGEAFNTATIDDIVNNLDEPIVLEDKIIVQATIDQDFRDDTVLVIIDKNFFYQQFTVEDFAAVNAISISWLTESYLADPPEALNHIYAIKLGETGKQNVLDAIKILETFDFVKCAEPCYIYKLIMPVGGFTPIDIATTP